MYHATRNNQEGVTLLLAVLILSTLAIISSAVAFFAIQETRSSRAVAMSEPAINAAQTGAEQGLWALKRSGTLNTCPTIGISNLSNKSQVNLCKSYSAATFYLKANVTATFSLYDPNDINGDVDLQGCLSCTPPSTNPAGFPYTWLRVTHQAGGFGIAVVVTRLNGNTVGSTTVPPTSTNTISIPAVLPGAEARMMVTMTSTGDATALVTTNQGMPDYPMVDAYGCMANGTITNCSSLSNLEGFIRRLNITVPQ